MESDHHNKVPGWAYKFLEWFCPPQLFEGIIGDLLEKFDEEYIHLGRKKARRKFIWRTIRFFQPAIVFRNKFSFHHFNFMMIVNYFLLAIRNLRKHKTNAFVNVLGLTLGIVCTLIIGLVIRYELSFDKSHTDSERIYRVVRVSQVEGQEEYRTGVANPLPNAIANEIPGLEKTTQLRYSRFNEIGVLDQNGQVTERFYEQEGCAFVDHKFFELFDFDRSDFTWLAGNPGNALKSPYNVVLTRSMAKKYFATEDVIGRTININFHNKFDLKVTGLIEDLPPNTDFPFKLLISYATVQALIGDDFHTNWGSVSDNNQCYVVLPKGMKSAELENQIAKLHQDNVGEDLAETRKYKLQSLSEVHSDQRFGNFNARIVTKETILALGIIGVFMLLMVSINFVNISTALAISRSKEVGIRKVMGSNKWQILSQSLIETTVTVIISMLLAMFLVALLIDVLQPLIGLKILRPIYLDPDVWGAFLILLIFITTIAGTYPALTLARYQPIRALRQRINTNIKGGFSLRSVLLVTQFSIMQVLIIATLVTVKQMNFFNNVGVGFEKEAIVNVEVPGANADVLQVFQNELMNSPDVNAVSFSASLPSGIRRPTGFRNIRRKDALNEDSFIYEQQLIDHQYLELYNIKIVAGRNFVPEDFNQDYVILNETLTRKLGYKSAEHAIQSQVIVRNRLHTIIGVVGDFYSNSLKNEYDKMAFLQTEKYFIANIKLNASGKKNLSYTKMNKVMNFIKVKWQNHFTENAFNFLFMDENVEAYYKEENRLAKLFQLFAIVFMIIGCLGLYGLVSFVTLRKTREMAVRKVFGASISHILFLFSKAYIIQVLIAFLIAAPIAYMLMSSWLNEFAAHISLNAWYFFLPVLFVLMTSLLSVSGVIWRSARMNPVENLKEE